MTLNVMDLRLFAEFMDIERHRISAASIALARLGIEMDVRYEILRTFYGRDPIYDNGSRSGKLHMCFYGRDYYDYSRIGPITINIRHGSNQGDSYNSFYNCRIISEHCSPAIDDILFFATSWSFSNTIATLNPPEELRPEIIETNELWAQIGIVPTRTSEISPKLEITSINWKEFGF